MIESSNPRDRKLIEKVYEAGQEHIFRYWDSLSSAERQHLLGQVETIDFELVRRHQQLLSAPEPGRSTAGDLDPAPFVPVPADSAGRQRARRAGEIGERAVREGRIAAFLVAGGQGTRLGFDGPKGCFPIGPVSGKTLFQMHAEKILAASRAYGVSIPWAIMTSEANDAATRGFFNEQGFFGLPERDVLFFTQRMIPALDPEGRCILERKDRIFMNPNGHGGSLLALYESGALQQLKDRGVEILSYFQVDNVLINIIDPVFIGYHLQEKAQMSSKMVRKRDPAEKVGVFGIRDGRLQVIEYSDMSRAEMEARLPDGSLKYGSGSIAIHLIDTAFAEAEIRGGFRLPYHMALKKVPRLDEHGRPVRPEEPNAWKFETFIFDALADTDSSVVMEIERRQEFSPVKNAAGDDSPVTARRDLSNYFAGWLEAAGLPVPVNEQGDAEIMIEISPLFAADREEFVRKIRGKELRLTDRMYLER